MLVSRRSMPSQHSFTTMAVVPYIYAYWSERSPFVREYPLLFVGFIVVCEWDRVHSLAV